MTELQILALSITIALSASLADANGAHPELKQPLQGLLEKFSDDLEDLMNGLDHTKCQEASTQRRRAEKWREN